MMKLFWAVLFVALAAVTAEARVQQHRGLTASAGGAAAAAVDNHPYLFLTVPRGRSNAVVGGFEVVEEEDDADDQLNEPHFANDDDEDDDDDDEVVQFQTQKRNAMRAIGNDDELDEINSEEDDDDDDDKDEPAVQVVRPRQPAPVATNIPMIMPNAKATQMMVSAEHAGAIMVPDGVIEIEGQSVVDENTGKVTLLVPRDALDAIPDGSVVALMERNGSELTDDEEERANRVIVRRRRRGSRRNVRRRGGNRNNVRRRRVNGNRTNRPNRVNRVNRRKNVRVIRTGNNNNNNNNRRRRRRGGNNRRRGANRPVVIQG